MKLGLRMSQINRGCVGLAWPSSFSAAGIGGVVALSLAKRASKLEIVHKKRL